MTYAITTPAEDPVDTADRAAHYQAMALDIALAAREPAPVIGPEQRDAKGIVHCAECGEPIPTARLAALAPRDAAGRPILARSTARLCIDCQEAAELWEGR